MSNILKSNNKVLYNKDTWTLYNGIDSQSTIGDTSTFAWMSAGVFSMEFEIMWLRNTSSDNLMGTLQTAGGGTCGFMFVDYSTNPLRLYWRGGGTAIFSITTLLTKTVGIPYKVQIKGDGSAYYYTTWRLDTGAVVTTNGPTGTTCTWNGSSTTTMIPLSIGKVYTTGFENFKIRNFKIFRDFAGTIPFMEIPYKDAKCNDVIGGLVGSSTGLSTIDYNYGENWLSFNEPSMGLGFSSVGSNATYPWMNDGTFSISMDIRPWSLLAGMRPLATAGAPTNKGFFFYANTSVIRFYWCNGNAGYAANIGGTTLSLGTPYRLQVQGNGTQIRYTQYNLNTGAQIYDSGWAACTFISGATTSYQLCLGAYALSATYSLWCDMKNVNIYSDSNFSVPFTTLNMQGDYIKDTTGGIIPYTYNVHKVNKNTNILRPKNMWAETLQVTAPNKPLYDWIHQTCVFRIEAEFMMVDNSGVAGGGDNLLWTGLGSTTQGPGFTMVFNATSHNLSFLMFNDSGSTLFNKALLINIQNGDYAKIIVACDGTNWYQNINGVTTTAIVNTTAKSLATAYGALRILYSYWGQTRVRWRNVKVYKSFDTSQPFSHYQLQGASTLNRDNLGNANLTLGTAQGTNYIVEL